MSTFLNIPSVGAVRAPAPALPSHDQEEKQRQRKRSDKRSRDPAASVTHSDEAVGDSGADGPHHVDEYA
jgi:hypothetical protein